MAGSGAAKVALQRNSALPLRARSRPRIGNIVIDRVVVTVDILREARLLAVLLGVIVLLTPLEEAVFAGVVVLADLGRIVSRA